jgi:integrase
MKIKIYKHKKVNERSGAMRVYNIVDEEKKAYFEAMLNYEYKLIYRLGCSTGLRISDIVKMKKDRLDIKEPTIIEQKTGKKKRIYIPKALREELKRYSKQNKKYIFESANSSSGHITRQAVWKHFKKCAKRAGIEENIGTHTMRKNHAQKLLKKGKGYKYIKNKLNHTSLADTLLYLITDEKTTRCGRK